MGGTSTNFSITFMDYDLLEFGGLPNLDVVTAPEVYDVLYIGFASL